MRSYSNFLVFEDVLDNLPEGSPVILGAVQTLNNPNVKVIEEDCGTLLGSIETVTFELEGRVELATGLPLTRARILTLLGQGVYQTGIIELHSCISEGGICQKCYKGHYLSTTAPEIGSNVSLPPEFIYQTDIIVGNNYSATYPLTQSNDDFYSVKVIKNGALVDPSLYSISDSNITFTTILVLNDIYVIHFIKKSSEPFLGYISKSYTGGLLGISPLPTVKTTLRESLYDSQISEGMLGLMHEEISNVVGIPVTYMSYIDRIHNKLEKALYIAYLYGVYANLQI